MNFCSQASERPDAARQANAVFGKDPSRQFYGFRRWLRRLMLLAWLILTPLLSRAQTTNVSREVSIFNFGQPTAAYEAMSREVSVFDFGQPTATSEAISREVSVFDRDYFALDSVSREVSVYNYGYNQFNLAVGSTVVLSGTSGGVPMTFSTQFPVTNVQVAVDFPQYRLTNWSVQPHTPFTATLVSNSTSLFLTFSPTNGQYISSTQQLGQINFFAISNQPSAFLPLLVAGVTAPMPDGETYAPYATAQDGEVVVLNKHSLLRESLVTNGLFYLTLYGLANTNYTIEATTNLSPPTVWQTVFSGIVPPASFISITPDLGTTNPAVFYRARQ